MALPLNLGAGFIWGPLQGSLFSILGSTTGATFAFLLSRYLACDYTKNKFHHPIWLQLQNKIDEQGWRAVAFIRLNPIISTVLSNYFFGISSISLMTYMWSTLLFMSLLNIFFAYIGDVVKGTVITGSLSNLPRIILIISAIVTLSTVVRIVIKRKRRTKTSSTN